MAGLPQRQSAIERCRSQPVLQRQVFARVNFSWVMAQWVTLFYCVIFTVLVFYVLVITCHLVVMAVIEFDLSTVFMAFLVCRRLWESKGAAWYQALLTADWLDEEEDKDKEKEKEKLATGLSFFAQAVNWW